MNLYVISAENEDDELIDFSIFQSEMTMDELAMDDWWEIAATLGLNADRDDGDTLDIEPIINPQLI